MAKWTAKLSLVVAILLLLVGVDIGMATTAAIIGVGWAVVAMIEERE